MIPIASPEVSEAALARIESVAESGRLADGPEVRAFEDEFAEYCDVGHGVATSNGTTALHTALASVGLGQGDTVLTTPFSFVASANAIRLCGAEPVFADINPQTYNIDPEAAAALARKRDVDAILVVHLYGLPADLDPLVELAADLDIPLIEDAAQAHGATYDGQRVGSVGDAACFSFYPTKNMTTGEGGMVITDRADVAEAAERFVNHGRDDTDEHVQLGHNFRMTSIAAAIGREQLSRLHDSNEARRENARRLTEGLAKSPLEAPVEPPNRRHVYHQYTVRVDDRPGFTSYLEENGVGYGVYYPRCIHNQPAYSDVTHSAPKAERASDEVVSLPVHQNLSNSDVDRIVEVVRKYDPE